MITPLKWKIIAILLSIMWLIRSSLRSLRVDLDMCLILLSFLIKLHFIKEDLLMIIPWFVMELCITWIVRKVIEVLWLVRLTLEKCMTMWIGFFLNMPCLPMVFRLLVWSNLWMCFYSLFLSYKWITLWSPQTFKRDPTRWSHIPCPFYIGFLLLAHVEKAGKLHGVKISRESRAISHLIYMDDFVIFCRADEQDPKSVAECMKKFSIWLGLAINYDKFAFISVKI